MDNNYTKQDVEGLVARIMTNTVNLLNSRDGLAWLLGNQFVGERDLFSALGYKKYVRPEDYYAWYKRGGIAKRIVSLPSDDTWIQKPILTDRELDENERRMLIEGEWEQPAGTPFMDTWKRLHDQYRFTHYLERADKLCGIGQYSVLLIGMGGDIGKPVPEDAKKKLLYLSVYSERLVSIEEASLIKDPNNPRFGLPNHYNIRATAGAHDLLARRVHHSRVIHVLEDPVEDEVYGTPRLEAVLNYLDDLLKIIGGGSEATWRTMDQGLHADVKEGYNFGEGEKQDLQDELDEYMHGLRRFVRTQGVDLTPLGSSTVDPTGLFEALMSLISGTVSIPRRILLGAEQGHLASTQDGITWASSITRRRTKHAEPVVLRPFVDRLISLDVLPVPNEGRYQVIWPQPKTITPMDEANIRQMDAAAAKTRSDMLQVPMQTMWREHGYNPQDIVRMLVEKVNEADLIAAAAPLHGFSDGQKEIE